MLITFNIFLFFLYLLFAFLILDEVTTLARYWSKVNLNSGCDLSNSITLGINATLVLKSLINFKEIPFFSASFDIPVTKSLNVSFEKAWVDNKTNDISIYRKNLNVLIMAIDILPSIIINHILIFNYKEKLFY